MLPLLSLIEWQQDFMHSSHIISWCNWQNKSITWPVTRGTWMSWILRQDEEIPLSLWGAVCIPRKQPFSKQGPWGNQYPRNYGWMWAPGGKFSNRFHTGILTGYFKEISHICNWSSMLALVWPSENGPQICWWRIGFHICLNMFMWNNFAKNL